MAKRQAKPGIRGRYRVRTIVKRQPPQPPPPLPETEQLKLTLWIEAIGKPRENIYREARIKKSHLSNIEKGIRMPSAVVLLRISRSLGVSMNALFVRPPDGVPQGALTPQQMERLAMSESAHTLN